MDATPCLDRPIRPASPRTAALKAEGRSYVAQRTPTLHNDKPVASLGRLSRQAAIEERHVPRGKPITIGKMQFPTQSAALAHFKNMLARYLPGDRVSDDDARELDDLLRRHPERGEKIGSGSYHFEVMRNIEKHRTKCFCVVDADGDTKDFSYPFCITGR